MVRNTPTLSKDVSLEWDDFKDMDAVERLLEHVYTIEKDAEIPATVTFTFVPGYAGCWYRSNGDPGDPPEPPEVEPVNLLAAYFPNDTGKCLWDHLTEKTQERLIEQMLEHGEQHARDEEGAAADYEYEEAEHGSEEP